MTEPTLGETVPTAADVKAPGSLTGQAPTSASPSKPAVVPPGAAESSTVAHVAGFRSAKFGMTETEVRTAVTKDFGLSGSAVKASKDPVEETPMLTVRVPDVLPGGGESDVAYVFGYKTKKLIQVSLLWSKATDPKITPERLVGNADILRANFVDQGYKRDTVVTNTAVKDGFLAFRGSDADDHTTVLLLQGKTAPGENDQKVFTPVSLLLFYVEDPKHPDVFRLAPGQF